MTDFYTLLKQSIIERDIREPQAREVVYSQAREAIIKQLWAFEPPLAADEIDTRVGAYDRAVERIEADLKVGFANGEIPERRKKPAREAEPAVAFAEVGEEEADDAPPIADWQADIDDLEYEDEPEAAAVPRAGAATVSARAPARLAYDEDAAYAEPAPSRAAVPAETASQRWAGKAMVEAPRRGLPDLLGRFGKTDGDRVQVLAGAITGLVLALALLAGYLLFFRGNDDPAAVTVDIGMRREVSDAATATRIANESATVEQSYSVFDGRDPTVFVSTPDNPVRFVSDGGGFARISSTASAPGVKVHIGPGLAARLAGREIRVTLIGRAAPDAGAFSMRFAYQSGLAISHWQTANLGDSYEAVAMRWRPPAMQTGTNGDYLLIEPGIPGDGTAVDIQSIKIDVLGG